MARKTGILKTVLGAAAVLAVTSLAALAATFAQPPTVDITAPASVKTGETFTVTGVASGTGVGTTAVTVTATGAHGNAQSVEITLEGTTPTPFEVEFRAKGHGTIEITATATGQGEAGPLTAVDATTVRATAGRSGK